LRFRFGQAESPQPNNEERTVNEIAVWREVEADGNQGRIGKELNDPTGGNLQQTQPEFSSIALQVGDVTAVSAHGGLKHVATLD
jgi:hypothetical protein